MMKDKRVLVFGMARSGIAAAKLLLLRGAKVSICDAKQEAEFEGALDELKMKTGDAPVESGLKYSRVVTTGSQEPCTVKVRYKQPLEDASEEIEKVLETAEASCSDNLRLAFIVYVCAEKLRGSDKISKDEIELAKEMYQQLGEPIREKNTADLYKLAGILDKSEEELGIGIQSEERFRW